MDIHSMQYFLFLSLITFIVFLYKCICVPSRIKKHSPPSPPKLPMIGNLHQLGSYPHHSLQKLSKKYGPLMLFHFGSVPMVIVSTAEAAKQIFKNHDVIFSNRRPKSDVPDKLLYGSKDIVFTPYGEYWRQVRSISVLHLLSNKRVQSFRKVREEETSFMIKKIRQTCCDNISSSSINMSELFMSLTNNIISRVAIGRRLSEGEGTKNCKDLIGELFGSLGTFNIGDFIPWLSWVSKINGLDAKLKKLAKEIDELLEGVIEDHMLRRKIDAHAFETDEASSCDFVDILLGIQNGDVAGVSIQRDSIKAIVMDIFSAATDTTATTLEWSMTELLRHPKTLLKLQNEVRKITQEKSDVTEDDLEKMPYLKAVIKESLRLHPPAPLLPREAIKDVNVMGYDIAAGTQVLICPWAIGRDPMLWENPEEFQPERFLKSSIDYKGLHFELIPFGAGRRGCPGITFSKVIVELALAKLMYHFEFSLPNGAKVEDLDVVENYSSIVKRKYPLLVVTAPHS